VTADELAAEVGMRAAEELADALAKIKHCLAQLDDAAIWSRPAGLNSIGNLLLHLEGNLTQWITSGLGGAADRRNRPAEFAERGPIPADALLRRLDAAVAQASVALAGLSAAELTRVRRIQGFDVTGLAAIFHSVPHFRGHAQEIIHITRTLLGDRYRSHWQPATPEQGGVQ
jgi:hypothetical protein